MHILLTHLVYANKKNKNKPSASSYGVIKHFEMGYPESLSPL